MKKLRWLMLSVLAAYVAFSTLVYRLRHPEQTETELFKNIPKALIFSKC